MIQPVGNDFLPVWGEYAFGVELHAAQVQTAVPQGHHHPFAADGGAFEAVRQRGGIDHPGVVAPDREDIRQSVEKVIVRRAAAGRLDAVEDFVQVDERAAEGLSDGLFAEAYAQDGLPGGIAADDFRHPSGFGRDAGTRGKQQLVEGGEILRVEAVVAQHGGLCAERLDQVHQVVGERVVIIYDGDFHGVATFVRRVRWRSGAHRACC